jgi:hypothetical protein
VTTSSRPILTTRRTLLGAGIAGVGVVAAHAVQRGVSPAIISGEITPERFGASGKDAAKDTAAWNRAVAEAARSGRPVLARGTYLLRAPRESTWNWRRRPEAPVHVAVQLLSGTRIQGAGATILVGTPEVPPVDRQERHFLFGTGENERAGTLRDISIEGLTFDFRDEFGPVHRFTYSTGIVGVDGFTRRNCRYVSTGERNGRGLLSQNVRRRTDSDLTHKNITQGIYTRYETGVDMRRIAFDGFNEAMDFDGPCWDVRLDQLRFANGSREAQCIDTGGGARWLVTNVTATDTGPIAYIYLKGNAWPTYAGWLASDEGMTPNYVIPEDMTFRGIRGKNAGMDNKKGEAIRIGSARTERMLRRQGSFPRSPRNITLEDWVLDGGSQIAVNDCENVVIRNIRMTGTRTPRDGEQGAAILLREPDPSLGGIVTGSVSDVVIDRPGGIGISAVASNRLRISNVKVTGFNTDAAADTDAGVRVRPRRESRSRPQVTGVVTSDRAGKARRAEELDN